MTSDPSSKAGIETLLEEFQQRFEMDASGRLLSAAKGAEAEGVLPRFVLGRAAEGCVWRFSAELSPVLVRSLAKLAGRERGSAIKGESTAPPERLVMMSRLLRIGDELPVPRRELISHAGRIVGELWTLD